MRNVNGNRFINNKLIYLIAGFIGFVLFIVFLLIYKPVSRYDKGKTLQALDPNSLPESQRWSRERTIRELENERSRRRMMRQDIYA